MQRMCLFYPGTNHDDPGGWGKAEGDLDSSLHSAVASHWGYEVKLKHGSDLVTVGWMGAGGQGLQPTHSVLEQCE